MGHTNSPRPINVLPFFLSSLLQRLLSPSYRGLNYENSTKRQQTDLRNKHFNCSFLVFSYMYDSHLNTSHLFGNVHVRVASRIFFFKKYVYLKHVLPESLERKYFSVHIAIFYKFAFSFPSGFFIFVNCVMVFFLFLFIFYEIHCFKWRRRE